MTRVPFLIWWQLAATLVKNTPTPFDTYRALLEGIDEIVSAEKDLGTQARGRRLARSYWEIGDAIHAHLLANEGKTTYGEGFFGRLATSHPEKSFSMSSDQRPSISPGRSIPVCPSTLY